MKTLYEMLGVDRQATLADIAICYRQQLDNHIVESQVRTPDEAELRRMRRLREAYLLLSSPSKRRAYDLKLARMESKRLQARNLVSLISCVVMLVLGLMLIGHGLPH